MSDKPNSLEILRFQYSCSLFLLTVISFDPFLYLFIPFQLLIPVDNCVKSEFSRSAEFLYPKIHGG